MEHNPSVSAMSDKNLVVAESLTKEYPERDIVIFADDDHQQEAKVRKIQGEYTR